MTHSPDRYETPKRPTFWLGLAFAMLVAVGVATVLVPELEDTAEDELGNSEEEPLDESTDEAPPASMR